MELVINDRIRNRKVDFFNEFSLSLQYDSVGSTFGVSFYFDPENNEHKELMCIGHYHICKVTHNNETLLTGNILSQKFTSNSGRTMVVLSGYSLGGVLEDCEIPPSLYPLQSDGLTLKQIATKLLNPFKLSLVVDSEVESIVNSTYATSTAKETQSVKAYLSELTAQKDLILSHNESGNILITKAKTNATPLYKFERGLPANEMELTFNGQGMHSHITVMKQADSDGGNAGEETIRNPYVINSVYRPKVKTQSSGDDNDSNKATRMALRDELKNLTLKIQLDRWELNGKIVKPNNIIEVINPDIYLYKKSKWFIQSIDFKGNEKERTATLNCVLPEVFNNNTPEYLFKGINLH